MEGSLGGCTLLGRHASVYASSSPLCTYDPEATLSVMAMCVVLNRSYCVCQKTKKKDIPFQHGKGRFQPMIGGNKAVS